MQTRYTNNNEDWATCDTDSLCSIASLTEEPGSDLRNSFFKEPYAMTESLAELTAGKKLAIDFCEACGQCD